MQNKPNLSQAEINANSVFTKDYEYFLLYKSPKNKANQTQFKPNFQNAQNERKIL